MSDDVVRRYVALSSPGRVGFHDQHVLEHFPIGLEGSRRAPSIEELKQQVELRWDEIEDRHRPSATPDLTPVGDTLVIRVGPGVNLTAIGAVLYLVGRVWDDLLVNRCVTPAALAPWDH